MESVTLDHDRNGTFDGTHDEVAMQFLLNIASMSGTAEKVYIKMSEIKSDIH